MTITLDYTNMMADAIGSEYGITDEELGELRAPARAYHEKIQALRESGDLAFYELPYQDESLAQIVSFAGQLQGAFDDLVVLGIGGSALGTTAIFNALCPSHNLLSKTDRNGLPRLFVLDNVDPDGFAASLALCDPRRTCFLVISKSGSTVETTGQFLVARQWIEAVVGDSFRDHFVMITDPQNGALRELAEREGYRSFAIPAGVGGRFSVFTPVGLLPLACVGVDIASLLRGAAEFAEHVCAAELEKNPAYLNAALQYLAYGKGLRISVLMPYSDRLRDIADWFRQLWAESLGKKFATDGSVVHAGPTPVNALGSTDQHSQVQLYVEGPFDKLVTFIRVENFDRDLPFPAYASSPQMSYLAGHTMGELLRVEQQATAAALVKSQRSNCTITVPEVNAAILGRLLYMFEVQTLFAGYLFAVNPLDQPGVEEGKHFTYALMGRQDYSEKAEEYEAITANLKAKTLVCK